jgi:hypothetical protein
MGFFDKIKKGVSSTAKKAAKTSKKLGTKVVKTASKQSTWTKIGKGAVVAGKGTGQVLGQAQGLVNKQVENSVLAPLKLAKRGLKEVGLDGSFLGPLGTFIKYLPYLAVLTAIGWFIVEYRKGNNRIVLG